MCSVQGLLTTPEICRIFAYAKFTWYAKMLSVTTSRPSHEKFEHCWSQQTDSYQVTVTLLAYLHTG
jgi:hypothetical protein